MQLFKSAVGSKTFYNAEPNPMALAVVQSYFRAPFLSPWRSERRLTADDSFHRSPLSGPWGSGVSHL